MKKNSQSLKEASYHEAGHLVANIIFKFNPKHATIIPIENSLGHVIHDTKIRDFDPYPLSDDKEAVEKVKEFRKMGIVSLWDDSAAVRKVSRKQIISALAGYEAQFKYNPKADDSGSRSDRKSVFDLLDFGGYTFKELEDKSYYYPCFDKLHKATKEFIEKHGLRLKELQSYC